MNRYFDSFNRRPKTANAPLNEAPQSSRVSNDYLPSKEAKGPESEQSNKVESQQEAIRHISEDKVLEVLRSLEGSARVANNFSAGMADALTGGLTSHIVEKNHGSEFAGDKKSDAYQAGEMTGLLIGSYIPAAKVSSKLISTVITCLKWVENAGKLLELGKGIANKDAYRVVQIISREFYNKVGKLTARKNGLELGKFEQNLLGAYVAFFMDEMMSLGITPKKQADEKNEKIARESELKVAKRLILNQGEQFVGPHEISFFDENLILSIIQNSVSREDLMRDQEVVQHLRNHLSASSFWKCQLLAEFRDERFFPDPIQKIWQAINGMGANETKLLAALESIPPQLKDTRGLEDILRYELSGDALQIALNAVATEDSIEENIFGGIGKAKAKGDLILDKRRLRKLINIKFVGASTKVLREAMEVLYTKPEGEVLINALSVVEEVRGLQPGVGLAQYQKALSKRAEGVRNYSRGKASVNQDYIHEKDNPSPDLDLARHGSFTASAAQLKFGKVVGDVFGIDAVFGSLISPTGGIVGPGNDIVSKPKYSITSKDYAVQLALVNLTDLPIPSTPMFMEYGPIATHGAIHDAVGYLYNCHKIGPGYDYLNNEPGLDTGNPLTGQSNAEWWIDEYAKKGANSSYLDTIGAKGTKALPFIKTHLTNEKAAFQLQKNLLSSNDKDKQKIANTFFKNDAFGFNVFSETFVMMRAYASQEVYHSYLKRTRRHNKPIRR